jgi:hypothetical protein
MHTIGMMISYYWCRIRGITDPVERRQVYFNVGVHMGVAGELWASFRWPILASFVFYALTMHLEN